MKFKFSRTPNYKAPFLLGWCRSDFRNFDRHAFVLIIDPDKNRLEFERNKVDDRLAKDLIFNEPQSYFIPNKQDEHFIHIDQLLEAIHNEEIRLGHLPKPTELLSHENNFTENECHSLSQIQTEHPNHSFIVVNSQHTMLPGCMLAIILDREQGHIDFETAVIGSKLASLGFGVIENSIKAGASKRTQHIQIAPLPNGVFLRHELSQNDYTFKFSFRNSVIFNEFIDKLNSHPELVYSMIILPNIDSDSCTFGICLHDPFMNKTISDNLERKAYIDLYKTIGVAGFECWGNLAVNKSFAVQVLVEYWMKDQSIGDEQKIKLIEILKKILNIPVEVNSESICTYLHEHIYLFNRYYYQVAPCVTRVVLNNKIGLV